MSASFSRVHGIVTDGFGRLSKGYDSLNQSLTAWALFLEDLYARLATTVRGMRNG